MGEELRIKGVVMVSALDVLLSNRAHFEPHVPQELRKYLDDPPHARDWYPTSHLVALTEAIRRGAVPEMERRGALEMMGQLTAQRDLFSDVNLMTGAEAKARGRGAYEGAIKTDLDFATSMRRALALWQLYYDQGEQVCERAGERMLHIRLVGLRSPAEELCWMSTGYYRAVVASLGVPAELEHSSCSARGDAECVWTVTFDAILAHAKLDPFGSW